MSEVVLNDNRANMKGSYYVEKFQGGLLFDSSTKNGFTVICCFDFDQDISGFKLTVLSQSCISSISEDDFWMAYKDKYLNAVAVVPESNRFLISTQHRRTLDTTLQLFDADLKPKFRKLTCLAKVDMPSFKKIVCFSKELYGALTKEGQFKTLHYKGSIPLFRKAQIVCMNQKHGATKFRDIAVNPTYKNKHGFCHRFALLSDAGDLFVTDLVEFTKPTLLLAYTLSDVDHVKNFYYENDELRIVYCDDGDTEIISRIDIYKDNIGALVFQSLIKQPARKQND